MSRQYAHNYSFLHDSCYYTSFYNCCNLATVMNQRPTSGGSRGVLWLSHTLYHLPLVPVRPASYDGTSPSFTALEVGVTRKSSRFALDSLEPPFPVSWIRHCPLNCNNVHAKAKPRAQLGFFPHTLSHPHTGIQTRALDLHSHN